MVSTRLTEADYRKVVARRNEAKVSWGRFITEALDGHYGLGLEGLPKRERPTKTQKPKEASKAKGARKGAAKGQAPQADAEATVPGESDGPALPQDDGTTI